jgi:endonuclease/exonuclease/phosphatase family metal-dependent hydrolase
MSVRLRSVPELRGNHRGLIRGWSAALIVLVACWFGLVPTATAQTKSLPGTIQAEDFDSGSSGNAYWDTTSGNSGGQYRSTDVDIEACSEGGYDVGWAFPGEWLNYTVNVASAGTYTVSFRVATANGGGFHLEVNGQNASGVYTVNPTGGWQSWTTVQKSVTLSAGTQLMRIVFDSGNVNVNWFSVTSASGSGSGASGAKTFPGTVQAEDFEPGANGSTYWDSSSGNSGGQYRSSDVDIEACSEGGYDVGWTTPGEWLGYTVNVVSAGSYTLDFRVATPNAASLHLALSGTNVTGSVNVPSTGGWQTWTSVQKTVTLSAGVQTMIVYFDTGNVNLNSITATAGSSTPAAPPPSGSSSPFGGVALAIPGWIQSEDFDNGGPGVAYSDNSAGNSGGAYRATDVDIEPTSAGGYAVSYTAAGEWLRYTVNVSSGGAYTAVARVASAGTGGTFHIEFDGVDKTGPMRIPNTGGWSSYQDLTASVSLSGGVQSMRIVFDANGSTGAVGNISAVRFDTGSSAPAPAPAPPPPAPSGGGRLRAMTWNINFGGGNTSAQAQLIASAGADVVTLQEASTYDENMPSTYVTRLQQLTGQTWYSAWGPSLSSGASQGTLILSRYPIVNTSSVVLDGTGLVRAAINVGGVTVQIFDVHLEYYDTSKRTVQLSLFMDWARQYSGPMLVGGDFNSWWGETWIAQMDAEYSDTWQVVSGSVQNGYTLNGSVRFDYLFRSFNGQSRITPTACWVQQTSLSDHSPVIADYNVQ